MEHVSGVYFAPGAVVNDFIPVVDDIKDFFGHD
jgi:hypothetical protein